MEFDLPKPIMEEELLKLLGRSSFTVASLDTFTLAADVL